MSKPKIKRGYRKPQKARPKEKDVPASYDSILEYTLHTTILKDWEFHGEKIPYETKHNYNPDFTRMIGETKIILEVKGRFWNYEEYSKYLWIKKHLPEGQELVFLFANPSAAMPQAKRRKDGTKRSHAEWATANDFRWFSADSMPTRWVDRTTEDGGEL